MVVVAAAAIVMAGASLNYGVTFGLVRSVCATGFALVIFAAVQSGHASIRQLPSYS